jgi:hypothetical protein
MLMDGYANFGLLRERLGNDADKTALMQLEVIRLCALEEFRELTKPGKSITLDGVHYDDVKRHSMTVEQKERVTFSLGWACLKESKHEARDNFFDTDITLYRLNILPNCAMLHVLAMIENVTDGGGVPQVVPIRYNFYLMEDEKGTFQELIKKIPRFYPKVTIVTVETTQESGKKRKLSDSNWINRTNGGVGTGSRFGVGGYYKLKEGRFNPKLLHKMFCQRLRFLCYKKKAQAYSVSDSSCIKGKYYEDNFSIEFQEQPFQRIWINVDGDCAPFQRFLENILVEFDETIINTQKTTKTVKCGNCNYFFDSIKTEQCPYCKPTKKTQSEADKLVEQTDDGMGFIMIAPEVLLFAEYYYDTEMKVFFSLDRDGNPSHGYEWWFNIESKQEVLDVLHNRSDASKKDEEKCNYINKWIDEVERMQEIIRKYHSSPRRSRRDGKDALDYPYKGFETHSLVDYVTYIRFD